LNCLCDKVKLSLPNTLKELIETCGAAFKITASHVYDKDGFKILDIGAIKDQEQLTLK